MRNHSYGNEFCIQFYFHANQSHFHKNSFALRLALKQRHRELGNGLLQSGTFKTRERRIGLTMDWYEFLCFGSPTVYGMTLKNSNSVPCDRTVQRAH